MSAEESTTAGVFPGPAANAGRPEESAAWATFAPPGGYTKRAQGRWGEERRGLRGGAICSEGMKWRQAVAQVVWCEGEGVTRETGSAPLATTKATRGSRMSARAAAAEGRGAHWMRPGGAPAASAASRTTRAARAEERAAHGWGARTRAFRVLSARSASETTCGGAEEPPERRKSEAAAPSRRRRKLPSAKEGQEDEHDHKHSTASIVIVLRPAPRRRGPWP